MHFTHIVPGRCDPFPAVMFVGLKNTKTIVINIINHSEIGVIYIYINLAIVWGPHFVGLIGVYGD